MRVLDTRIEEENGKFYVLVKVPFLFFLTRWIDTISPFVSRPDAETWARIVRRASAVHFI